MPLMWEDSHRYKFSVGIGMVTMLEKLSTTTGIIGHQPTPQSTTNASPSNING